MENMVQEKASDEKRGQVVDTSQIRTFMEKHGNQILMMSCIALTTLSCLDALSTSMLLKIEGMQETNPIVQYAYAHLGDLFLATKAFGSTVFIAAMFRMQTIPKRLMFCTVLLALTVYSFAVMNNLASLLSFGR